MDIKEVSKQGSMMMQAAIDSLKKLVVIDVSPKIGGKTLNEIFNGNVKSIRQFIKDFRGKALRQPGMRGVNMLLSKFGLLQRVLDGRTLVSHAIDAYIENYEPIPDGKWYIDGWYYAPMYGRYVRDHKPEQLRLLVHTLRQENGLSDIVDNADDIIEAMKRAEDNTRFNGYLLRFTKEYDSIQSQRKAAVRKIEIATSEAVAEKYRNVRRKIDSNQAWTIMGLCGVIVRTCGNTDADLIGYWLWAATKIHPVLWFRVAPDEVITLLSQYYWKLRDAGRIYRK